MSLLIDANMKLFSEKLGITSTTMINDYGNSTIDEIIASETEKGNTKATQYVQDYYNSPQKLIDLFKLTDVENRFRIINHMDERDRLQILPQLSQYDLMMGLYFFRQPKLLEMLQNVKSEEIVRVALNSFSHEHIISMFTPEDLSQFFMRDELHRADVLMQLSVLPQDIMQKFVEGVTGMPMSETEPSELISSIANMPIKEYRKFMASIDPDVQRQLTYQLTSETPEYLMLFPNESYTAMLSQLQKPDLIKSMYQLDAMSLIMMNATLPKELMSIVAAQIDAGDFAAFLQDNRMNDLEKAFMM